MSLYRKKPVVIEAFRWTGDSKQAEDPVWIVEAIEQGVVTFRDLCSELVSMRICTLEGIMTAERGDWVIKGIKGEIYPCRDDIFRASYEAVDVQ